MKSKIALTLAAATFATLALAGCSASTTSSASGSAPSSIPTSSAPTVAESDAATATSSLGTIIVNGKGLTAYAFDTDVANSGTSICTDVCATTWPAITTTSATPTVTGITGTISTITGVNGTNQITVNGMPIYTFSKDAAPGDVKGQGVKGTWHALTPAGEKVTTPAAG